MDLTLNANEDFVSDTIEWNDALGADIDLAGFTAAAQVRQHEAAAGATNPVLLEFLSSNGAGLPRIEFDADDGLIMLSAPKAVVAALTPWRNPARWDLVVTSAGGVVTRLVRGYAVLLPGVTA